MSKISKILQLLSFCFFTVLASSIVIKPYLTIKNDKDKKICSNVDMEEEVDNQEENETPPKEGKSEKEEITDDKSDFWNGSKTIVTCMEINYLYFNKIYARVLLETPTPPPNLI